MCRVPGRALPIAFACFVVLLAPRSTDGATITQWNFNSSPADASTSTGTATPAVGSGSATLVGTTATFASGAGSSDPDTTDDSGWNTTSYPAQGSGSTTEGVQFAVSTVGRQNIVVTWDQRHSNTSSRYVQFQYSIDGTTFTDFGVPFEGNAGDTWFNGRTANLSSIAAVNDNPNFAFRIVSVFAPATSAYAASNAGSTYAGTGTWRFDMVTISGDALGTASPSIQENTASPFVDLPANGPGAVSGVIDDPTDPARTIGLDFAIADADTAVASLTVTATSGNPAVVSNANLVLTGAGASRNLKITPTGVGVADITVTVSDGSNTATYVINYAASAASVNPPTTRFHTSASDASTAVAIDADYMLVADDEDQIIRLYSRHDSGLPLAGFDVSNSLGLTGGSEVDIEAAMRVGVTVYWAGSHSNNSSGSNRDNRERVFSTQLSGAGAATTLTFGDYYAFLEDDLIAWDAANGHGLGANGLGLSASAADGVVPEQDSGFNIEGLTMAPDGTTAFVAFRAPLQPTSTRTGALIVPVLDFTALVDDGSPGSRPVGSASFGSPMFLDLGGRGIRAIDRNSSGQYLIVAGPAGPADDFKLFTWTGVPGDTPLQRSADLTALAAGGSIEAIVEVPSDLKSSTAIQLLVDNGDTVWYAPSLTTISKDLSPTAFQKFRSEVVTLGTAPRRIVINETDSDTPGTDAAEFVELYDGGEGNTALDGLVVVLFNGSNDLSYAAFDLDGRSTDVNGYFVLGNAAVTGVDLVFADNTLQNGADAVALYSANAADFPNNTAVTTTNLLDAVVYDTSDADDTGLLVLLNASQPQVDENGNAAGATQSLQRIPNGAGGLRTTSSVVALAPTPDAVNVAATVGNTVTVTAVDADAAEAGPGPGTFRFSRTGTLISDLTVAYTLGGSALAGDYTPALSGTIVIPALSTFVDMVITPVDDAVSEGSETLVVTLAAGGYTVGSPSAATVTIGDNEATVTMIHDIQGSGSAVTGAGPYIVEAIVVGDYQTQGSGQLRGFFIQEEDADADANPATSEGIFVFCSSCPTAVSVGDKVQVTGTASDFFDMSQLTASTASSVVVVDSGNTLPTPATAVLPVPGVPTGDLAGATAAINAYFEAFEGMLVTFPATLTVSEYFELARYGQVILSQGGRPTQFTHANSPSLVGLVDHQIDLARRTIILDDTDNRQNRPIDTPNTAYFHPVPGLSTGNFFRGGDTIANLTGVLHWSFAGQTGTDAWRIRPVTPQYPYAFTPANPRPIVPSVGGTLEVASFNVLNYFLTVDTTSSDSAGACGASATLDCRGADSTAERDRQQAKLTQALAGIGADVFGLVELENTPGVDPLAEIVADLNAVVGAGTYAAVGTGVVGTDAITVGLIYKPSSVTPIGSAVIDTDAIHNRPPVAQLFETAAGERFTVVVNHFKSKGCGSATGADLDQLDGQGCFNARRVDQADALLAFVNTLVTQTGDPDVLVIGDLNAYAKEDPVTTLRNGGLTDLVDLFGGVNAYSYVFDGQLGYLDHALATVSMTGQVTGAAEWHINADEIPLFDYNDTVRDTGEATFEEESDTLPLDTADQFRTSDHDPVIVGLNLSSADLSLTMSDAPDPIAAGNSLVYTIAITNGGPSVATSVTLTDVIPGDTVFQSLASPSGWTCTTPAVNGTGTISCSVASMPVGTETFTLTVLVNPNLTTGAGVSNLATVASSTPDPDDADTSASATTAVLDAQQPSLSLTKTTSTTSFAQPGDLIAYTLVATNSGNVTLSNVLVVDPLLPSLTCTPAQPAVLSPGATLTCSGTYAVTAADLAAGLVTNTATASAQGLQSDVLPAPIVTFDIAQPEAIQVVVTAQATVVVPAIAPGISGTRLALTACTVELQQDWQPRYTKLQFDVWNEDEVKFTGAYECADSWHETDFGGSIDAAAQNFTIGVIGTYGARYRVQAVTSTQCPGARATGLLGVQSSILGANGKVIGSMTAGAGKFVGSIRWDPSGAVPEGGPRP